MDSSSGSSLPSQNPWSDSSLFANHAEHAEHSSSEDPELMDWIFAPRNVISLITPTQSPKPSTQLVITPAQSPTPRPHLPAIAQSPTPLHPRHISRLSNISMHAENSPNRSSLHAYPPSYGQREDAGPSADVEIASVVMLRDDHPVVQESVSANASAVSLAKSVSTSDPLEVSSQSAVISGQKDVSEPLNEDNSNKQPVVESMDVIPIEMRTEVCTIFLLRFIIIKN